MRPQNRAFIGMPGTGKSYAARIACEHHPRVVYLDPMDSAYSGHAGRRGERWTHVFSAWNVDGLEHLIREGPPSFRATMQAGELVREDRAELVERIGRAVSGSGPRSSWTTLVVDEIGVMFPRGTGAAASVEPIERLLRVGRHPRHRVCVYLVSQRAVDLPPTMRALCEVLEVRRQTERVDLDRLDAIERGLGERARLLEGHEYLRLEDGRVLGPLREV